MSDDDPLDSLSHRLPRHARLLESLRAAVTSDDRLRWLELGCSLGAGRGDEHSDADVGIGYAGLEGGRELAATAASVVAQIGTPIEALVHRLEDWPDDTLRVAAEYDDGVQIDLVLMPAERRPGLPDRAVALVDKDGQLARVWTPAASGAPSADVAREWLVLGWWALSDAAKYVARASWFEAVASIDAARHQALRLAAAGDAIPYPSFGLTSLLDFPPLELPAGVARAYASPTDPVTVVDAAWSCAHLLDVGASRTSLRLGIELATPLADAVRNRLPRLAPGQRGERAAIGEFLGYQRDALVEKVQGLSEAQARSTPTVSTLSLLSLLKHSAIWEKRWFQIVVAGRSFPGEWPEVRSPDPEATFLLGDDDTIESVVADYRAQIAASDEILDTFDLDTPCAWPEMAEQTVRWVALHMIEETARHAGHADVIRESIDGTRGR
jgi:hypothetical protein